MESSTCALGCCVRLLLCCLGFGFGLGLCCEGISFGLRLGIRIVITLLLHLIRGGGYQAGGCILGSARLGGQLV